MSEYPADVVRLVKVCGTPSQDRDLTNAINVLTDTERWEVVTYAMQRGSTVSVMSSPRQMVYEFISALYVVEYFEILKHGA